GPAMPGLFRRLEASDVQQEALRVFQRFLDCHQGQHSYAAVDDTVVIGQCQVVHRADDDLAVFHNRTILGGVNAEDRRLRRINDGCGEHGTKHTTVGDGEGTSGQLFQTQFAVARTCAEVGNRLFDI